MHPIEDWKQIQGKKNNSWNFLEESEEKFYEKKFDSTKEIEMHALPT